MKAKSRIVNYLFFPFRYIAGGKSLLGGLLVLLILIFGGHFSHTYFDGVLDVHVGNAKEPSILFTHIGYVSISWITVTLVFYLAARILSRSSVRLVDMAGTLALSQAPKIFLALLGFTPIASAMGEIVQINAMDTLLLFIQENIIWISIFGIVSILFILWSIFWMYNAYSVSGNLKGGKGILSFIAALILAEILSKICLFYFQTHLFSN